MIFTAQAKVIAALTAAVALTGYALYVQIGRTAEVKTALKTFQAELAKQVEEKQRVDKLLIEREKQAQAARVAAQKARSQVHEAIKSKPPEDCINAVVSDDIKLLLNGAPTN